MFIILCRCGYISFELISSYFFSDDLHELYRKLKMLVLDYLGLSSTATTDSEFITSSFTDMSSGSRGSEKCPRGSEASTATTTASQVWSRPRSDISNSFTKTNLSFHSSKISSVEQASVERRRILAKAALAGIPYVSKEQLINLGYDKFKALTFRTGLLAD